MKRLCVLLGILSLLLSGCKDNHSQENLSACGVKDPVNNVSWLKQLVEEARQEREDSYLTIRMFDFEGQTYFSYYKSYMSCIGCVIYDCNGTRFDFAGFSAGKQQDMIAAIFDENSVVIWGM